VGARSTDTTALAPLLPAVAKVSSRCRLRGLGADSGRSGGAKRLESEPQKRKALLTLPFINAVPSAANHRSNPSVQARNRISGDAIMGAPNSVETALRKDPVSFRAPVRTLTLLTRIR